MMDFEICYFASGCWSVLYLSLPMVIGCFVPVLTNYLPSLLYMKDLTQVDIWI